ncbi:MAG: adenylate/guanylate cyclase domain-containing protein [Hyphomicrobiaceae bacterium]
MGTLATQGGLFSLSRKQWLILLMVQLSNMLFGMTITLANLVLPQVRGTLSATQDEVSWVITLNLVATAIATPMTGWLSNRFGWRNTMFFTVLGFTVSSFLCGIANSLDALIFARVAQGLFGAPIMPMGQAILLGTFPRHLQPLALVMWGVGAVFGPVVGPIVGSLATEAYNWRAAFFIIVPPGIGASLEKKRLRDEQRELVRRFATSEVAQDLQQSGFALGGKRVHVSVMFSDIRGFTAMVESQPPEETIELLNTYYTLMFDAISSHGGVVNQMIGDGLMALFGAPLPLDDCAPSAVAASLEMIALIEQFNIERTAIQKTPIRIGIGIATGDVVAGYTGTQQRATYTCIGDTVNLAARLEAHTKVAGHGILIDNATQQALGSSLSTQALGEVEFKGKTAAVKIFAVTDGATT